MGWIEFQIEVIKKLRAKDEGQYPMNEVWVVPRNRGRAHDTHCRRRVVGASVRSEPTTLDIVVGDAAP